MDEHGDYTAPSAAKAGLLGLCPRCGSASMFKGYLGLVDNCPSCGLSYDFVDSADGPAVFASFIVGFIVVGLALVVELTYEPPLWVHAVLWLPLIIILSLGTLRPLKSLLIVAQYIHKAREGKVH